MSYKDTTLVHDRRIFNCRYQGPLIIYNKCDSLTLDLFTVIEFIPFSPSDRKEQSYYYL